MFTTLIVTTALGCSGCAYRKVKQYKRDKAAYQLVVQTLDHAYDNDTHISECVEQRKTESYRHRFVEPTPAGELTSGPIGVGPTYLDVTDAILVMDYGAIPENKRASFASAVAAELRARHGDLEHNKVNDMILRRHADNIMSTYRVRPTHKAYFMPLILHLVYQPPTIELTTRRDFRRFRRYEKSWLRRVWNQCAGGGIR